MEDINHQLMHAFHQVFEHLNTEGVKKGVDDKGLDPFIKECAQLAAMTGVASGLGGPFTIAAVPVDILNNIIQQFRVTMAVLYHRKGVYKPSFEEFMKIVGMSLGIEVGMAISAATLAAIAAAILARLSPSLITKPLPLVSSAVGGTVNYWFIRGIAKGVKAVVK
jgi:hypothetical protein